MSASQSATLRCPSCGAPADPASTRCHYCRTTLAAVSCPSCFGVLFEQAAFCQHCGTPRNRSELAERNEIRCPACAREMRWTRVGEADLLECGACGGTWVEAETFERICRDRESYVALQQPREAAAPSRSASAQPVRYRRCPRCAKVMNRVNFARVSGAVVDVCKGDGTFLDAGELHQIVRFIQDGGLERSRAAEREQLVEEQRRLRDLQRTQAGLAPAEPTRWNEDTFGELLRAMFGRS